MNRLTVPIAIVAGTMLAACSTGRMRAEHPVRGGVASAPIETPAKLEYPAGGSGVLARSGPVFIAGQPTEESLRTLIREHGITKVINLRSEKEMTDPDGPKFDEAAVLRDMGVTYAHIPLSRPDHPATPELLDRVAAEFAGQEAPVLLHCASAGRASHVWAAYLIRHRGVSPEKAVADAALIQPNRPMYADLIGADVRVVGK